MKSFTIYEEYHELIKCLSDKDRLAIYDAIFKYMFEDVEFKFDGLKKGIWINLKRPLDKSKNNSKRSIGNGAPIGNQNASKNQTENKPNSNQNQTENKPKTNTSNDVNVNVNNYDSNYNVNVNVNVNKLFNYIEDNFKRTLNPIEYEMVSEWNDNELTRYAIKQAILNGVYNIKYINGILQNYKNRNISTVQQAQEEEQEYKKRKNKQQIEKGLTAREKRDLEFEELLKKYGEEENNDT